MSRLTPQTYVTHRHHLQQLWDEDQKSFSILSSPDQAALHAFYAPAINKTYEELVAHRHTIKQTDPSLPNRAGKAYAKLMRGEQAPITHYAEAPYGRRIYLRTVMRPKPDVDLLAKAFYMLAQQENSKKDRTKTVQ